MSFTRAQRFSGRSHSTSSSQAPVIFSSFGSQSAGGLQGGAGLGFGSSTGLGYGSSAGLGYGSSAGLGYGSSAGLGYGSSAGLGFGSGFGAGLGSGFGVGGGSLSGGLRTVGGALSAAGGGYVRASFRAGSGSFSEGVSNIINEKQLLQALNDRLATYLEKVKHLETTHHELKEKLSAFTANRVQTSFNLEPYEIQIKPLREKLLFLIQEHARISLAMDNAKMTADDFRMKFETELAMRQSVEGDIAGLKTLKKEYESTNTMLQQERKALEKECSTLKKLHQKEMISLRGHMAGTVTVDIKKIKSTDLSRVLAEIRSEYEMVIERNRRELESWYTKQKANVEQRLVEVQAQYQAQIFSLSQLAGSLEGELMSVRENAMQQSRDYQLLLSTKVQLEHEISTYKGLLEGVGEFSAITLIAPMPRTAPAGPVGGIATLIYSDVQSNSSSVTVTEVTEVSEVTEVTVGGAVVDVVMSAGGAAAEAVGGATVDPVFGAIAAAADEVRSVRHHLFTSDLDHLCLKMS
ncbi:Keratin, type I cuticular Ha5 [Anabarilius grahami]|uniref:Keratin, type I cuticular Ha5 n=1 Tax=Anabarilius grahami TaxID=495550 RepID=A0A3N0Z8S7_ANAGA|nr:Keratin, type I cuticular Ha5 [Anabarilius grahami]